MTMRNPKELIFKILNIKIEMEMECVVYRDIDRKQEINQAAVRKEKWLLRSERGLDGLYRVGEGWQSWDMGLGHL